jgi:hypothetical protein
MTINFYLNNDKKSKNPKRLFLLISEKKAKLLYCIPASVLTRNIGTLKSKK